MFEHLKKLLKGSAIYGIGNALNSLIQLFLLPLFTAYLLPVEYGIISTLSIFSIFISSIFSFGFGSSIGLVYFDKSTDFHKEKTIWSSFVFLIIIGLIINIIGNISIDTINDLLFKEPQKNIYLILTLINASLITIQFPLIFRLQFEEKQLKFVLINLIFIITNICLKVLFIVKLNYKIEGFILSEIIGRIICLIIYLITIIPFTKIKIEFLMIKKLIKFGLPMMPSFLSIYILQQGNIFFLQYFFNLEVVGIYSIGFTLGYSIVLFTSSISTAWFPFFMTFKDKQDEAKTVFGKMLKYYIICIGFISICYFPFSKIIIYFFADIKYSISYKIIGFISLAYFIQGLAVFFYPPFYFIKKIYYTTIFQFISCIIYIIFAILLISNYSILGAALSLIIGNIIINLLHFFYNKRNKILEILYEKQILYILGLFIFSIILYSFIDIKNIYFDFSLKISIQFLLLFCLYLTLSVEEKNSLKENFIKIRFFFLRNKHDNK